MNKRARQYGFSLMELLVTIAIIAILVASVIKGGTYLLQRERVHLAQGTIDVLDMALEQYYTKQEEFPIADENYTGADLITDIENHLGGTFLSGTGTHNDDYASSEWLYYCLSKVPQSNSILNSISDPFLTSKDGSGVNIVWTFSVPGGNIDIDMLRLTDPWGNALKYIYLPGQCFPEILSVGPDGIFENADDISNK